MAIPLLAIGAASAGAGLLGSLLSKPKGVADIDISGEIARITALYEQARQSGRAAITQDYQAQRGELASSQAARGILRSPVSSVGLERLGAERTRALSSFDAQILGSQAGTQSQLLQALMGQKRQRDQLLAQQQQGRQNAIFGGLTSFGTNLALASALRPQTTAQAGQGINFADPNAQSFYRNEFR